MNPQPAFRQPVILVLLPPSLYARLMPPAADAALHRLGTVILNDKEEPYSNEELAARIIDADALVTGWGSPKLTPQVLANASRLRIISHAAGSVKAYIPAEVWQRGIVVTNAAATIAPAVAEYALMAAIYLLRNIDPYRHMLATGQWKLQPRFPAEQLAGKRVGLVGVGLVARELIKRLKPFACDIVVYDPYLADADAARLDVRKIGLDELLKTSRIISMHSASTPDTHHMIGASQLALLQDGAVFINSARSWLVDMDALLAELQSGRIRAAIDVYDREPLPADSPFRSLPNLLLTPHMAGESSESYHGLGLTVVQDLQRFFAGEPPKNRVSLDQLATMA